MAQQQKTHFEELREGCEEHLKQYIDARSNTIENGGSIAVITGGSSDIKFLRKWVRITLRREKKWSKREMKEKVIITHYHAGMSAPYIPNERSMILVTTEAFYKNNRLHSLMRDHIKTVIDMSYIHRPVLQNVSSLGYGLVQKVFNMDQVNYDIRLEVTQRYDDVDFEGNCRLAEHQIAVQPPVPPSDGETNDFLKQHVRINDEENAVDMIGLELPTIRVRNGYLDSYLKPDIFGKFEDEFQPFSIGERGERVTMDQMPLARILRKLATDNSLTDFQQYSLVSLVASSQITSASSLNQIFSCMKTLLFKPFEVVEYRIWINVYLRHFLEIYGATQEVGLAIIHMGGGMTNRIKHELDKFLGNADCKEIVEGCLQYLLKVFGEVVDSIITRLKEFDGCPMITNWKKYRVGDGMSVAKMEQAQEYLVDIYKQVCPDEEGINCKGFVLNARPTDQELPELPEKQVQKKLEGETNEEFEFRKRQYKLFQYLKKRVGFEKARTMYLDYVYQVNDWSHAMDDKIWFDDFQFLFDMSPPNLAVAQETFKQSVRVMPASMSGWVFEAKRAGKVYSLRRAFTQLTKVNARYDAGLFVEQSEAPTPFGKVVVKN